MGERVEVTGECLFFFFFATCVQIVKKEAAAVEFVLLFQAYKLQASLEHEKADFVENNEKRRKNTRQRELSMTRWYPLILSRHLDIFTYPEQFFSGAQHRCCVDTKGSDVTNI